MKITIITVVYNDIEGIESTIINVLSQQYDNVEYIIIDGGSTDGTLEIIEQYKEENIVVISESDEGIYDAMNKGAKLATGKYLLFMNSGDSFFGTDVVGRFVTTEPHEDLVCGNSKLLFPDGREVVSKGDLSNLLKKMPFNHQACFIKTDVQNSIQFDTTFKIAADYDFILRAYKQGKSFKVIDLLVSNHDLNGISNTDPFRASVEGVHALLNHDTKNTIDFAKTDYFAKFIVGKMLNINDSKFLVAFINSVLDIRTTVLLRNPLQKIKFFAIMCVCFVRLYRQVERK